MSAKALSVEIKMNLPIIFGMMTAFHVLMMLLNVPAGTGPYSVQNTERKSGTAHPINLKNIRRIGAKNGSKLNDTFLVKNDNRSKSIVNNGSPSIVQKATQQQTRPLSMKDLSLPTPQVEKTAAVKGPSQTQPMKRPGTRPDVGPEAPKKAIDAVSLKGNAEMRRFLKGSTIGSDAIALSGDERQSGFSNSDVMVNLEVPEGVSPDELNEYEMMFYGFQRRTAINYVNSFYNNLDEFQKRNPHKRFPMTDTKQVMTGRLTYDEHGNIKQIKMIRWSNVGDLQDFFVDVLKDMDTLHNPPTALWKKNGEFSVFFSLVING